VGDALCAPTGADTKAKLSTRNVAITFKFFIKFQLIKKSKQLEQQLRHFKDGLSYDGFLISVHYPYLYNVKASAPDLATSSELIDSTSLIFFSSLIYITVPIHSVM
jgi:endonuclease IV